MSDIERPQYYEGEYLGADDLAALVRYARDGLARHALGEHLWGIAVGLDLVERSLTGDAVEVVLTPGIAWDGYGRGVVAFGAALLTPDLFASVQGATPPEGVPLEVWLTYRELAAGSPGAGFACPGDDAHGRIAETFRIEVRRAHVTDYHGVTVAGRPVDARNALKAFDTTKSVLYDESVPHQTFPQDGDKRRWPIFAGIVRWKQDLGQGGGLIKRTDADRNLARQLRRYGGVVAETIVAADGRLRLRDRPNDPDDPVLNYQPPTVSPAGAVVNDLVWCEGHLRVVGDTRLQAGKLDYRVAGGGDAGVPMYLRRTSANQPVPKTTLDAFIGPPAPVVGATPETRFTVSSTDAAGAPKECLTVVSDGRVGVNQPDPTARLHLHSDDARQGDLELFSAGADFEYDGGNDQLFIFQDTGGSTAFMGGKVGLGTTAPAAKLHVHSDNPLQGELELFSATADFEYDGGTDKLFVFKDNQGGATAFVGGDIGIGTMAPGAKVGVVGNNTMGGTAVFWSPKGNNESRVHWDADGAWFIRSADGAGRVVIQDTGGNVGIGTEHPAPAAKLDIRGDLHLNGNAFVHFGGIWTTSDAGEKQAVHFIERPLDQLLALRGRSFEWRESEARGMPSGPQLGFIAQEVEKVFPHWVRTTPLGAKGVNLAGLNALVVESVRILATRCDQLETELARLRDQAAKDAPEPQ